MLNPFVLAFARPGYWNWTQDLGNWSPSAETSEGSSSAGSVGAPKPIAPEVVDPPNPQPAPTETKVDIQCQWFQALLAANPVLQGYKCNYDGDGERRVTPMLWDALVVIPAEHAFPCVSVKKWMCFRAFP